jgi:hypothetical protein
VPARQLHADMSKLLDAFPHMASATVGLNVVKRALFGSNGIEMEWLELEE